MEWLPSKYVYANTLQIEQFFNVLNIVTVV